MSGSAKYWGGRSKNRFDFGPFETRELALGATIASYEVTVPATLYTGEELAVPIIVDPERVLDDLRGVYKLPTDWGVLHDEAEQDLESVLNRGFRAWCKRYDLEQHILIIHQVVAHPTVGFYA